MLQLWIFHIVLISGSLAHDFRLSDDVVPHHYDLMYTFDIDPQTNFTFFGVVKIFLTAHKTVNTIVLHAKSTSFQINDEKMILESNRAVMNIVDVKRDDKFDFVIISCDKNLNKGDKYILTIPFSGNVQRNLQGVYISSYLDEDNKTEYLITSHFEAIAARQAFPCFDEPKFKATFKITIGHHNDYNSLSNMPLKRASKENALQCFWSWEEMNEKIQKPQSCFQWHEFKTSVPMSTYLVAFVISKFGAVISPEGHTNTTFRCWAKTRSLEKLEYASTIGPKLLSFYESFFDIDFSLPKLDVVAIPDIAVAGMENWGLITIKEDLLFFDNNSSSKMKEFISSTVAHELVHQWFGNLVTMKWWTDLWLNEGITTYLTSIGVASMEPDWDCENRFAIYDIHMILELDSLESSHPVSFPIDDPTQFSQIFDTITYNKGSALVRMMSQFLGEKVFWKAMRRFLVKHSYSNVDQDDLWQGLTEASQQSGRLKDNVTVKDVMDTWTIQAGYPVLNVIRNYEDKKASITQERFLTSDVKNLTSSSWWIPFTVLCEEEVWKSNETEINWISKTEGTGVPHVIKISANDDEWLLLNHKITAPYRVNYDLRNWQLLTSVLKSEKFSNVPVQSRTHLLLDAFALSSAGSLPYSTTLELASYLRWENADLPLSYGIDSISKIRKKFQHTSGNELFKKYMHYVFADKYNHNIENLQTNTNAARNAMAENVQVMLIYIACHAGVSTCQESAINLFQQWMDDKNPDKNNPIPLDLRSLVYCSALESGTEIHWKFLFDRMQHTQSANDKVIMIWNLACTNDKRLLKKYLELSITNGSIVHPQSVDKIITAVTRRSSIAKSFIYNRIEDIIKTVGEAYENLATIIEVLADSFSTKEELDEFLAWREKHSKTLSNVKVAVDEAVEKASMNIAWIEKNSKDILDFLKEFTMKHS